MRIAVDFLTSLQENLTKKRDVFATKQAECIELAKDGDLKENEGYIKLKQEVSELADEILEIERIIYESEIIEVQEVWSSLDVGCKFNLSCTFPGTLSGVEEEMSYPDFDYSYNNSFNQSKTLITLTLSDTPESYLEFGMLSIKSPLGKFLKGKRKGTYEYYTTDKRLSQIELGGI